MALTIYGKNKPAPHGGANKSEVRLVSVNKRWGAITFNQCTVRELGIETGMKVLFANDEDTNAWYFSFGSDDEIKDGSKLRENGSTMRTQNRLVSAKILAKLDKERATFNVSQYPLREDGKEWWKILIKTPYRIV